MNAVSVQQFIKLARQSMEIQNDGALPWDIKSELLFSPLVTGRIRNTGVYFNWSEPEGSSEEGVRAFVKAMNDRADQLEAAARN